MRVPEPGLWGWSPARFPVRQDARNPAGGAESAPRRWGACPGLGFPGTAVSSASSQPHAEGPRRPTCLWEGSRGHDVAE